MFLISSPLDLAETNLEFGTHWTISDEYVYNDYIATWHTFSNTYFDEPNGIEEKTELEQMNCTAESSPNLYKYMMDRGYTPSQFMN